MLVLCVIGTEVGVRFGSVRVGAVRVASRRIVSFRFGLVPSASDSRKPAVKA